MNFYRPEELLDKRACSRLRADLKKCLLESECCRSRKRTPRECLEDPRGGVPDECFVLRTSFWECKRSTVDMRVRFRGRKGE
ncbi:UNVERIFIED_CONTAM: hypothetical protein PYX00_003788 [Menopon gallinae]|uniref:Cytochrome c oxidase assembly factor 5 n=1 Tax=Menopon gallinae TaxID=328185 RepID=A0AAW2I1U4_9NEOP